MNYKVMIVDDDAFIRLAVSELLQNVGIQVIMADGALSCIQELEKGFSGLVLMDVMMPEFDGWDAIRMIIDQGHYRNIIISMLTAMEEPDRKMEGLQAYVTDYITKPFDSGELVDIVRHNLSYLESE